MGCARHARLNPTLNAVSLSKAATRLRHHHFVKPLYTARLATDAHLICGYLESHGIAAVVRGEFLAGAIGELPADICKVWIVDDGDLSRAEIGRAHV